MRVRFPKLTRLYRDVVLWLLAGKGWVRPAATGPRVACVVKHVLAIANGHGKRRTCLFRVYVSYIDIEPKGVCEA